MQSSADDHELRRLLVTRMKAGATSIELLHWLRNEHGVAGERSHWVVASAAREHRAIVRKAAATGILVSAILLVAASGLAWISTTLDLYLTICCAIVACLSAMRLIWCLVRIFAGGKEEAMAWET